MSKAVYSPLLQGDLSDEDELALHDSHTVNVTINGGAKEAIIPSFSKRHGEKKRGPLFYVIAVLVVLVLVFGLLIIVFAMAKRRAHSIITVPPLHSKNKSWQVVLNSIGSESCIRTQDVDGDGLPDVLVGLAHAADLSTVSSLSGHNGLKKYCAEKKQKYPCVGFLLALRGYDGKELWRLPTRSEVIFILCDSDLNRDGHKDCVVSGRQSTVMAVDVRHGKVLWYSDGTEFPKYYEEFWNVYQPLTIPDTNNDEVPDLIISHGGDPNIPAEDHNRKAGRIMVLSGATGHPLGNYLELPNNKETYMSPVLYRALDESQYLLVGSGGETVPGDLLAISLPDFLTSTGQTVLPAMNGQYEWKKILKRTENNFFLLYKGTTKGIMVPPVIVEVNGDEHKDILVSAFDGSLVLIDGQTLTTRWTALFSNKESYSTPAPGYFNDDDTLDFMVHWSIGAWPDYTSSTAVILNGKDGTILWNDTTSLYQMSSDLVVRSKTDHFDHFILKMRGKKSNITFGQAHGIGVQRVIDKRESQDGEPKVLTECESMLEEMKRKGNGICSKETFKITEEVFILNRKLKTLVPFHETLSTRYDYDIAPEADEESCIPINKETGKIHMCVPEIPDSRSTDSITDVDGDGSLDLIHLGQTEGRVRTTRYSYKGMRFTTIISRMDILKSIGDNQDPTAKTKTDFAFAPLSAQPWLEYLGTAEDSIYYKHDFQ